jgi:hypothetical protein
LRRSNSLGIREAQDWEEADRDAQANFPMWVAAISGQTGKATANGFVLEQTSIQVFEKKPKAEAAPPQE